MNRIWKRWSALATGLLLVTAAQGNDARACPVAPHALQAARSARRTESIASSARATTPQAAASVVSASGGRRGEGATPPAKATPSRAQALVEEARRESAHGRKEQAVALFERALALEPGLRDARNDLGWTLYRLGRFGRATEVFLEATRRDPSRSGGWTGLGYARLQSGDYTGAEQALGRARRIAPRDSETLKATALVYLRTQRSAQAIPLLRDVLAAVPADEEATAALGQALASAGAAALEDRRLRPAARTDAPVKVPFRAGARYFEVRKADAWVPLLVKGVNMGVALPGKFPAEFPVEEDLYRDWLGKIRAMNANVVRAYTLLPPVFYRALVMENRAHPRAPLYLVQGVWVELPPDNRFDEPGWNRQYAEEIRRVLDAVHGNIEVAPRPGHAFGVFDTDASPWLLGLILGREWEPFAVSAFDGAAAGGGANGPNSFEGRYVRLESGTRMEAWIASTLETAAAHEAEVYGESRPLAFTNWPTLDPLAHPTEATREEEDRILERLGRPRRSFEGVVYDNDGPAVDAQRMSSTPAFPAGLFTSYHVYPYFPDFLILDPGYRGHRGREGPDAYAGYLRDLVRHHAGRPVLIAEVGVPTSRGVAHSQPQGFDHGGHGERAQAAIDARLVRTIQETGCAGAVVFSWMDEWFKRNWLVSDLEIPAERNPLWLNAMDPEQNFGIMAAAPGPASGGIVLDGRTEDWAGVAPVYARDPQRPQRSQGPGGPQSSQPPQGRIRALYAASDEAYLYLRLDVAPAGKEGKAGVVDGWTYWIGIDTYDRALGARDLPGLDGCSKAPSGLEYAIRLDGEDPRLLVAAPYDIGSHRNSGPYASLPAEPGQNQGSAFISMKVEIRMERIGRDGTIYPAETHDLSPLRRGTTDPSSKSYDSLADLFENRAQGVIEIRIPWNLLNVTDPSTRRVVHQPTRHMPPIETTLTDGFVFYAAAVPPGSSRCADERPRPDETADVFRWKSWETPRYHLRLKAVYGALETTFEQLDVLPQNPAQRPGPSPDAPSTP